MKDRVILEKNLECLLNYNSVLLNHINELDFNDTENVYGYDTEVGIDTAYINYNEKKYFLHSVVNPLEDAKKLIKPIDFDRDSLIIVFGIGLGYHLHELKKNISKDTRVIVVEHNIDVFKYVLKNINLIEIFNSPQFLFVFGDEKMQKYQIMIQAGYNFYNLALNIQYIIIPNYYIYNKQNKLTMIAIKDRISSNIVYMGNSLEDMFNGFRNNYLNIEPQIKCNSISEIRGKFENKPAIIVSSGPSLEKNIDYIKKAEGKALIIACDASLNACEIHGIKPDAIASIERDEETYTYYYKDREIDKDIVLVGPGLLWPKIFEEYEGKMIIMSKFPKSEGVEGWWYSNFDNIEFVNQGMSCANVAFSVARESGCNPIILIGQDLAYTDDKIHSDISHTEHEGENNLDNHGMSDEEYVFFEDYEGNPIKSNWFYKIFKEWFEHQAMIYPELKVIDATEGGAFIKGTTIMKFEEAINEYCVSPIEKRMVEYLRDIEMTDKEITKKVENAIENVKDKTKKLEKIKRLSSNYFNKLMKVSKKFNNSLDEDALYDIVIKMQRGDEIIKDILKENTVSTFYRPIITQTIIQVKQIGNGLTYENVKNNLIFQLNLMNMIKNSTDIILKEYKAMEDFLIEKKNSLEES